MKILKYGTENNKLETIEVSCTGRGFSDKKGCGALLEVNGLDIKLCMDFERGKGNNYDEHENSFTIIFKPYEITFARKSNHNDPSMNKIEEQINEILKKFPVANSIFCNKQNQ